jgi:starch synthase (maltosyl-transferring)
VIIYGLFPTLAGPFSRWGKHFRRATEMGFDWLFLNPIQLPGASGSLYSVADYFKFNPLLLDPADAATPEAQARAMTKAAHAAGLKLMIDLVVNHCAVDSALTREHPEWFVHEDGRIANPSARDGVDKVVVWKDLARFDHEQTPDREGLYQYCRHVVEYLLGLGFDGFRCDAAYQLPRDFWRRLIHDFDSSGRSFDAARAFGSGAQARRGGPERGRAGRRACFVAETLGCTADQTKETAMSGFRYIFNSVKWWDFYESWLFEQYQLTRDIAGSIGFPESHDTERLCTELGGNVAGLKQRYLFSALFSTGVMIPIGFEFGFRKRLDVVKTRPTDWEEPTADLRPFITAVNAIKKRYSVFHEECPASILPYHNPSILLLWKAATRDRSEALIILNKDIQRHQEFATDNFRRYVQSQAPLRDVSPEYALEFVPEPFHYALRPGQGIVLVTTRG